MRSTRCVVSISSIVTHLVECDGDDIDDEDSDGHGDRT